jgi:GMP synthase (glutamine-hydrolysing)
MIQVLVFRHVPFEHPGLIARALASRGIACEQIDLPEDPGRAIALDTAAALLFMGGPMSANEDLPSIRRELDLIQQAWQARKLMLGVCLGAQLIAKALGARVYPAGRKEIGWAPVHWTEAARRDPLLEGLSESEVVFHWHGETFDLPRGAEWLAYSDACRHQAFRAGSNVYGFQFHLEVTPEMISGWCREESNAADVRELPAAIDPHAHAARLAEVADLVFGRWADMIRRGSL